MPSEINKQILSDVNTGIDQLKNQAIEMSKSLDELLKRQKDLFFNIVKKGVSAT